MKRYLLDILSYFLILNYAHSQIIKNQVGYIPATYQVEWIHAGLLTDTPGRADRVFDITKQSGSNDTERLLSAITKAQNAAGLAIIYFPAGTYIISQPVELTQTNGNGIIFQGDGPQSKLSFKLGGGIGKRCFYFHGQQTNTVTDITDNIYKGSDTVKASLLSDFSQYDWVRISEYNFPGIESDFKGCVGQITQLTNIDYSSGIVTSKDKASKFYSYANTVKMWKIIPIQNVGIENLTINRLDNGHYAENSNVLFEFAVNCWVKGVQSEYTQQHHIDVRYSSHIEISGCYFDNANFKGDGGYGYGVVVNLSVTNCLIQNNIFNKLRHAMLIQGGANANVFSYNFSTNQQWNYPWPGSDLLIHGNYPYANLFEQNYVELIQADNVHRNNGPYNVFLRNKLTGNFGRMSFYNAPFTAVLACEINTLLGSGAVYGYGNTTFSLEAYGAYKGKLINHFGAVILNSLKQEFYLEDDSYFYSLKPDFVSSGYTFPSIGPREISSSPMTTQSIPARGRYLGGGDKTYNSSPTARITDIEWYEHTLVSDWNGDGREDIAYIDPAGNSQVWFSADSGFSYQGIWGSGHGSIDDLKIGDFNNDGKSDLARFDAVGNSYIWLSTDSSFSYQGQWGSGHGNANEVKLADFNNDNCTDVAQFTFDGNSYVWLSTGSSFSYQGQWGSGHGNVNEVKLADFNNDKRTDVAQFTFDGNSYVWLSTGSSFSYQGQWGSGHGNVNQVKLADFNNDRRTDVAQFSFDGKSYVWLSTGSSFGYQGQWGFGHGNVNQVKLADFNNDNRTDVAQFSAAGNSYVWLSTGSGFSYQGQWGSGHGNVDEVKLGDFNHDDCMDIARFFPNQQTDVWLSTGSNFSYKGSWLEAISNKNMGQNDTRLSGIQIIDINMPADFKLFQNFPNPFNPNTTIRFFLKEDVGVLLEVYNALGQRITTLIDQRMPAGFHEINFNAGGLAGGIYFYRFRAGKFHNVKKMLLVK